MREPELFEWLRDNFYPDLAKSESEFDGFDCQSDEHKLFIELKSRKTHYDELLIEKQGSYLTHLAMLITPRKGYIFLTLIPYLRMN
jgi:hypothetical protein